MDPINTLVTAATEVPVSQAEIKAHCRVDHDDDNGLLDALVLAATAHVEERVGKRLLQQTWRSTWDGRGLQRIVDLPVVPVVSVDSISFIDRDGQEGTATVADFHLVKSEDEAWLEPKAGNAWPVVAAEPGALWVTYKAGFGSAADSVPPNLVLAIKQIVAHWYEHRETMVFGASVNEVPMMAQVLINQSRIGWVGA